MAISIEPEEIVFDNCEDCIFCGQQTIYWHVDSNRPVCPKCSVLHEETEISTAKFNY